MKSKLGYLLSGPLPHSADFSTSALHIAAQHGVDYGLQEFWAIEAVGTSASTSTADKEFTQSYINSCVMRNDDGSYTAGFPWKANHLTLPTNQAVCTV